MAPEPSLRQKKKTQWKRLNKEINNTKSLYSFCVGYKTYEELKSALQNGDIQGVLVDTYVAAHLTTFNEFRINKVLPTNKVYGIVLGSRLSTHTVYEKMLEYTERYQAKIIDEISRNTKTLLVILLSIVRGRG